MNDDLFDLGRFVDAQRDGYAQALAELRNGRKESHWMWFIFPQAEGLGASPTARHYAIKSRAEAEAYLAHPLLGARLKECSDALLALPEQPIAAILGHPDDLKLKSSLTLFAAVGGDQVFTHLLDRYYRGERCAYTLDWLAGQNGAPSADAGAI